MRPENDLDDFLSSDLEISFASTMSLNSPPGSPERNIFEDEPKKVDPVSVTSPNAMDISPVPLKVFTAPSVAESKSRQRASTVSRMFGRDMSNNEYESESISRYLCSSSVKSTKGLQRSALPTQWINPKSKEEFPPQVYDAADKLSDAMDIDDCILPASLTQPHLDELTIKLAPAADIRDFSGIFFDSMSPPRASSPPRRPLKRRSLSPEGSPRQPPMGHKSRHSEETEFVLQPAFEEFSSPAQSSPSAHVMERFASAGGSMFGKAIKPLPALGIQGSSGLCAKRPRRPAISALGTLEGQSKQALLFMDPKMEKENRFLELTAPRRAFSATNAPKPSSPTDNESDAPDFSSPAAHAFAKRQTMRTLRRRDGTDDFRSNNIIRQRDANPVVQSPLRKATVPSEVFESPSARWLKGTGIPGFGDNEAHGKVLPCEKVSEDGLMRISVRTMNELIAGKYDSKIASYKVIDCRFDYEYQGGHIKGAININTTAEIEEYLLGEHADKPVPTCSGDNQKKIILIFHCEFSAKRAPTFAKHLRAKDRAMNNHMYPRIHYPEVYVLKGGYNQYFNESAFYSEPRGYVRMDDPQYARDRRQDLDQFRTKSRFGRTRSYAYGENNKSSAGQSSHNPYSHHQRHTAPSSGSTVSSLFPAVNAGRTKRSGTIGEAAAPAPSYLSTLDEDLNVGMTSDDSFAIDGVDKSPCPPPMAKKSGLMSMAMLGARRNNSSGRGPLQRAHTFVPTR